MNVSKAGSRPAPSLGSVPSGAFSWATIYQFDEKESGKVKSAIQHEGDIFTGSQQEGIKRWSISTGG